MTFFGTHNDIFNNPKTTAIEFLTPLLTLEVTIFLWKLEEIKGLPNGLIYTETIRGVPLV